MWWTPPGAVVVGNVESGGAGPSRLDLVRTHLRSWTKGAHLVGPLLGVAMAGLVHAATGKTSAWVGQGFLSAVAGGCAYVVVGAGLMSGKRREAWIGLAAGASGFALACVSRTGGDVVLGAAFAVYALTGLLFDGGADQRRIAPMLLAGLWSTFHAVLSLLVLS